MATNTETLKDLLVGNYATPLSNATAKTEVAKLFTDIYTIVKTSADSTFTTTTAATALPLAACRNDGVVKAAYLRVPAAVTGTPDSTNNAVFTLKSYPAAGTTGTTVATYTTTSAWTAFTRVAMTLATTASQLAVVEGGCLSLEIAKGGTGVTLPILSCEILVEKT